MRSLVVLVLVLSGCLQEIGGDSSNGAGGDPGTGGDDPGDMPGDGSGSGAIPPGSHGVVVAIPGGTSIAVRWSTVAGATSYTIERDGAAIATQTPGFHADFPEKDGSGLIDRNVTPGVHYAYHVIATGPGTTTTDVGSVTATLPTTTTPKPVITIDASQATDLQGWMQSSVQPFLETWYPKIGDTLTLPEYAAPHALSLKLDPTYDGVAYTSNQQIVMSATYARAHPQDLGAWLHEATHALQSYANMPGWITEGMADYSREYILHDRDPSPPGPGNTYLTGYAEGSYFLAWIDRHHDTGFVHQVNVVAHANTYTDAFFTTKTGKSIDALWTEMTGAPLPSQVRYAALTNKCLQAGDATTNRVQISTCNGATSQAFGVIHNNDATISVAHDHDCIDVAGSATTNGATIWMYPCNGSGAQKWVQLADGSLRNPASGRCLDRPSATDGSSLQLLDCNGGTAQRLVLLP